MAQPPRLTEIFTSSEHYFVTTCTLNRRAILTTDSIHEQFRTFCQNGSEYGAFVGRYVIMPDHIHLFVCFHESATGISGWMKSLKNTLSKGLRKESHVAPHWQKGFFDHLLRSEESYAQKWQYTRMNPVRAGLVQKPEDWAYQGEILPSG